MVGNDVVDLGDREARTGPAHSRFDTRVFSAGERRAIAAAQDPNRTRWSLWAAKEAAYKVAAKHDPDTVFSPVRFTVKLQDAQRGEVTHPDGSVGVTIHATGDAVHAVARDSDQAPVITGLAAPGHTLHASTAVRQLALNEIAARIGVSKADLRIGKRGRVPTLELRNSERRLDLSLSHHGRYVAFTCQVEGLPE